MITKQLRSILIPLLVLSALLMGGCTVVNESIDIHKVANKIAGYELPQGYNEQFAVEMLDYQVVSLVGKTDSCHIYLVQAPKGTEVDIAKLQEQARSMETNSRHDRPRDIRVVETRTVTIRGQEVPMAVGEGINSEDKPYREINALFEGRGGPALVSFSSPVDLWDWDQVNTFLASIE